MPKGIRSLGGREERNVFLQTAHLGYSRAVKAARPWARLLSRQLCSALNCSCKTPSLFHFQHITLSLGSATFSLWWKGQMCSLSQRGGGVCGQKSPHLVPHANENPKYAQFDCSTRHCPDWLEWNRSDWSVKMLRGLLPCSN